MRNYIILLAVFTPIIIIFGIYSKVFGCGSIGNPNCYGMAKYMQLINVTTIDKICQNDTNSNYTCHDILELYFRSKHYNDKDDECRISTKDDYDYYYINYTAHMRNDEYLIYFNDDRTQCNTLGYDDIILIEDIIITIIGGNSVCIVIFVSCVLGRKLRSHIDTKRQLQRLKPGYAGNAI